MSQVYLKGGDTGQSTESHGNSQSGGSSPTNNGNDIQTPHSIVRQFAIANNMNMGELSRLLKSWRSLDRADAAYAANADNLKSLPGRQLAYASQNLDSQIALAEYNDLVESYGGTAGDPPPSEGDYQAALGLLPSGVSAADVLAAPEGTYDDTVVAAAQTVTLYEAWQNYQQQEGEAQQAFLAAMGGSPDTVYDEATYGPIREKVDEIIALRNLADFY